MLFPSGSPRLQLLGFTFNAMPRHGKGCRQAPHRTHHSPSPMPSQQFHGGGTKDRDGSGHKPPPPGSGSSGGGRQEGTNAATHGSVSPQRTEVKSFPNSHPSPHPHPDESPTGEPDRGVFLGGDPSIPGPATHAGAPGQPRGTRGGRGLRPGYFASVIGIICCRPEGRTDWGISILRKPF